MKNILLFASVLAILFSSCAEDKKGSEIKLSHFDKTFTLVEKGSGEKLKPGDVSLFSMVIRGDDGNVLLAKIEEKDYGKFALPDYEGEAKPGGPVDEMLSMLVEGDSAVFVHVLDSLEKQNPALAQLNSLAYEVSIKQSFSPEEFQIFQEEFQKKQNEASEEVIKLAEAVGEETQKLLAQYKNGELADKLIKTESGLEYVILEQGDGPIASPGQQIDVHYYGVLESDGSMFDNSYKRGNFFNFAVGTGQVIKGWDEGFQLLNKGSKAILFLPYELAYGAGGRPGIPGESNLVFYVEYP